MSAVADTAAGQRSRVGGPAALETPDEAVAVAAALARNLVGRAGADAPSADALAALDASGLLAITLPDRDLGARVVVDVVRTIAGVAPALAVAAEAHYRFVDLLATFGSPAQQARLFADIQDGRRLAGARAELGLAPSQELQTRLRRTLAGLGRGLRLDGRKHVATGALAAHWLAVTARDEEGAATLVFVERSADGVLRDDSGATIERGIAREVVNFVDVHVDPSLVFPGHSVTQTFGTRAQLYRASIAVGIATGALADAQAFLAGRSGSSSEAGRGGWPVPAIDDPHLVRSFGELATRVRAAEALLHAAAATVEAEGPRSEKSAPGSHASLIVAQAHAYASQTAAEAADRLCAWALPSEDGERTGLSRHWRNARIYAAQDPADWKYHDVGHYLLGAPPVR